MKRLKSRISTMFYTLFGMFCAKGLASYLHYRITKKKINWSNPLDLNEKINWLKFNSDTSRWSDLADKYKVREFLIEKGLGNLLPELYGVWDNADLIDFSVLPNQFVLKTNHGSGDIIIVKDKSKENLDKIRTEINKSLKFRYGLSTAEKHYLKIKPLIIAEELLENDCKESTSLVDYKIFCFNGNPYSVWCTYNRKGHDCTVENYDMDWNFHPEWHKENPHYKRGMGIIAKPVVFERMLNYAKIISAGFPLVRVDFYVVGNKVYFGEMTFTPCGGYQVCFSDDFLMNAGKAIRL